MECLLQLIKRWNIEKCYIKIFFRCSTLKLSFLHKMLLKMNNNKLSYENDSNTIFNERRNIYQ